MPHLRHTRTGAVAHIYYIYIILQYLIGYDRKGLYMCVCVYTYTHIAVCLCVRWLLLLICRCVELCYVIYVCYMRVFAL